MRRLARILLILLLLMPLLAAILGWLAGPTFLHPIRRELTQADIREADAAFSQIRAQREEFDVTAPDGVQLRGWKVRPASSNGNWVLLFHGVADNRMGAVGQAQLLLTAGYSIVMMDSRAHGASGGPMATYGWLERNDTRAVIDALERTEHPSHLFALGESMGAGIALQSASVDPRIEAVVAESSFANLREASYDYAGLQKYPWLGKTLFAPGAWTMIYRGESLAGFSAAQVSPEKAVADRSFPVLLICDAADVVLPCRHTEKIYAAAWGPKQLWIVPKAFHASAIGFEPLEFQRRILAFFAAVQNPASNHSLAAN
ncbi:MAG TPA: alpha/beta fold hydrolase [Candidatus Acidoferrum sp.]|jgi:hypothetical protein